MEIKLDKRNYRVHSAKNKSLVRKSLQELGAGRSIIIDNEGNIIGGNCTYEQAKKLNIPIEIIKTDGKKLIAIQRTDLKTNDEKRKKLAVMDNSTSDSSSFDMELLSMDFDKIQLADMGIEFDSLEEVQEENQMVQKKLLKCPACGHINEEKAFKTYSGEDDEDTE